MVIIDSLGQDINICLLIIAVLILFVELYQNMVIIVFLMLKPISMKWVMSFQISNLFMVSKLFLLCPKFEPWNKHNKCALEFVLTVGTQYEYMIPLKWLEFPICDVETTGPIWENLISCRVSVSCFEVVPGWHPIVTVTTNYL